MTKSILIWGLATLFYFYDNLLQISVSAMKPELILAFNTSAEQFGSLSAYCLFAYGIMQIPAGILVDKYGPRRLLTFACAICALGSLLFGIAEGLAVAKLGRIFIGAGAAFALVCCLKLAMQWFSIYRFALLTGATVTIGYFGAVFSSSMVASIVTSVGWRTAMQWGAAIGGLLCVLLWFIIKDAPDTPINSPNELKEPEQLDVLAGLAIVIKNKQVWLASLYASLMFVPVLAFAGLWGIPYMQEAHGLGRDLSGQTVSFIYIGFVVGATIFGWFSDAIRRRNVPMYIANIAVLFLCLGVIYLQDLPLWILKIELFMLGFFSSGFIIAFSVIRENNPTQISGAAIGFINTLNTLGGALAQPAIGKILDMQASGTMTDTFSLQDYQTAFIALPVCVVLSLGMLLFVKETHCKPQNNWSKIT